MSEASSPPPRVLVLLGNAALNGQERGNIEALYAARSVGADALFVTHADWGHAQIQPALDRLGLRWKPLAYAYHFTKRLRPLGWVENLGRLVKASWGLGQIARRYKPTHLHAANQHYVLSVLPALLLMRTPLVYRLGDVPTQHHALYRFVWRWFIVPRVERFVCISEYIRESLIATGAPAHKAQVLYSYPPERPAPEQPVTLDSFDGQTVAYIGQIRPHKGVGLLVEVALALCRERADVRFVLAGAVTKQNPFALELLGKVQAAGLADRIRFVGYLEDVPGLLAGADVHTCPSVCNEALGNVVLEAKQAGVPSVVFPDGGLPELVEHGVDGFVCRAKTAVALREGIEYYLDMDAATLGAAKEAAGISLLLQGITRAAFAQAWGSVYGIAPPDEQQENAGAAEGDA